MGAVAIAFEHVTSRPAKGETLPDPQLHTHLVVVNMTPRKDGSVGTVDFEPLRSQQKMLGALYRAQLAYELERRLGVEIERKGEFFEIKGIAGEILAFFSKRRRDILEVLEQKAIVGDSHAALRACIQTRREKPTDTSFERLVPLWGEIATSYGFTQEVFSKLIGVERREKNNLDIHPQDLGSGIIEKALTELTKQLSHFTRAELVRVAAVEAQGAGISAARVIASVERSLVDKKKVICLGTIEGEVRYTTPEVLKLEEQLYNNARVLHERTAKHLVSVEAEREGLRKLRSQPEGLSDEKRERLEKLQPQQIAAYSHIVSPGDLKIVGGAAGTGKTYLMKTVRETFEASGYEVIGLSLAGKAAEGLQRESGVESKTIDSFILSTSFEETLRSQGAAIMNPLLSKQTVLIVDEAAMADTEKLAKLLERARIAGAKVVLIGDEKQLQAVGKGGAFRLLGSEFGRVNLTHSVRQQEGWASKAAMQVAEGEASAALRAYAERGCLHVGETREKTFELLINQWQKEAVRNPEKHLILASTNEEVKKLNTLAQQEMKRAGKLGSLNVQVNGTRYHVGDRILFLRNTKQFGGLKNGQLATMISFDPILKAAIITLEDGTRRHVNFASYQHVSLGYAVTTHKAQGITVSSSWVLGGAKSVDREASYVQLSRHKDKCTIFTDAEQTGDAIANLAWKMTRSRQKVTAFELLRAQQGSVVEQQRKHTKEHEASQYSGLTL
jgi:Ti-type conjugative transfer relaxase TraA